jgi:hypothetical protein
MPNLRGFDAERKLTPMPAGTVLNAPAGEVEKSGL